MNYFITSYGKTLHQNLNKENAIKKALKESDNGVENLGIGRITFKKGKKYYVLLPLHIFLN